MGSCAISPFSSSFSNSGVSSILFRMMIPMMPIGRLNRKGTRQAQSMTCSEVNAVLMPRATSEAMREPMYVPVLTMEVWVARHFAGADSATKALAPASSPPAAKPCRQRHKTSRMVAHTPEVA